jgi:hypothetical protein
LPVSQVVDPIKPNTDDVWLLCPSEGISIENNYQVLSVIIAIAHVTTGSTLFWTQTRIGGHVLAGLWCHMRLIQYCQSTADDEGADMAQLTESNICKLGTPKTLEKDAPFIRKGFPGNPRLQGRRASLTILLQVPNIQWRRQMRRTHLKPHPDSSHNSNHLDCVCIAELAFIGQSLKQQ